jgi:S1-C subfamily serine protease
MKSFKIVFKGISVLVGGFLFISGGCLSPRPPFTSPVPPELMEKYRPQITAQAKEDPLIGMWSGLYCGVNVVLAVVRNDEGTPYKLKAVILNGSQLGSGYSDGDPRFYVNPLAEKGLYEGIVTYRNVLIRRWFPTRVVMKGPNVFTHYDDYQGETKGGTVHSYLRKEPSEENDQERAGSGSGFLLCNTSLALTANHVVEKASRIKVYFKTNEEYEAHVLFRDSRNDLALLEIKRFNPTLNRGFKVNPQTVVSTGEQIHALGYPLSSTLSRHPSIVSGQVSSDVGLEDSPTHFRMTVPINPGNSGGPILNQQGEIVGIAVSAIRDSSIEGITFGIKIGTAFALLQKAGVQFYGEKTNPLTADQIFKKFSQDVVLIEVH